MTIGEENGSGGDESFVESVGQEQQEPQTRTGTQSATATTSVSTGVQDPEIKAALLELAKGVKGNQQPTQQQQELTQDQKDELWAVYNPEKSNPDFFKKWMRIAADADPNEVQSSIAERKALFLEMQQGLMRQAITGSRNLMQIELAKLREEFSPISDYVSSAKAEKTREKFFTQYPALRDENEEGANRYAQVIDAVARTLADKTFDSEESYFKALAEGAAGAIKGLVPSFDLGAKTTKKPAVTSPRLPRSRVGGTGGTAAVGATPVGRANGSDDDSETLDWMK